jgi:hypothetical protein
METPLITEAIRPWRTLSAYMHRFDEPRHRRRRQPERWKADQVHDGKSGWRESLASAIHPALLPRRFLKGPTPDGTSRLSFGRSFPRAARDKNSRRQTKVRLALKALFVQLSDAVKKSIFPCLNNKFSPVLGLELFGKSGL